MKTIKKLAVLLFAIPVFFTSCSSDDNSGGNQTKGEFDNGIFVLNEGSTPLSSASVTFIGNDGAVEQDIFRAVNPDADEIGTYLQSMFFDDTRAYIISGSANSVTVVNRYTFKYITTISTGFDNPRYGVVKNGKAYVVNQAGWMSGDDDYLTVVNLSNYSTSIVNLGVSSDHITEANGKVYVSNGYYGSGNSITVINPNTDTIETTIDLGEGNSPSNIEEEDGVLYVLTNSQIIKINTSNNTVSGSVEIPSSITTPKHLTIEDDKIYFTGNETSVYSLGINATSVSTTPILTYTSTSDWGAMYGFAVEDGKIYVAEGGTFASDSEVYIYSASGALLNTYPAGIGPNGFYFND